MQTTQNITTAVWPVTPRRSTLRRQAKMKALIAELTRRDMNHWAVAEFLDCSCSAARTYMKELAEAGIAQLPPRGTGRFFVDRADYSLTADADAIADFLQLQTRAASPPINHSRGFNGLLNGRRVHIPSDDAEFPAEVDMPRARRDPLVSALFGCGKTGASKNGAAQP